MIEIDTNGRAATPARTPIGLVDGSEPASTRRFQAVVADEAVAQLDVATVS